MRFAAFRYNPPRLINVLPERSDGLLEKQVQRCRPRSRDGRDLATSISPRRSVQDSVENIGRRGRHTVLAQRNPRLTPWKHKIAVLRPGWGEGYSTAWPRRGVFPAQACRPAFTRCVYDSRTGVRIASPRRYTRASAGSNVPTRQTPSRAHKRSAQTRVIFTETRRTRREATTSRLSRRRPRERHSPRLEKRFLRRKFQRRSSSGQKSSTAHKYLTATNATTGGRRCR